VNNDIVIFQDNPDFVNTEKYYRNRIMYISEHEESTSQAIYEWHKVYASLFNLESLGNEHFNKSVEKYECAIHNAAVISTQKQEDGIINTKPTVLWAFYSNYQNHIGWDVGTCNPNNYYCDYGRHCQVELLHSNDGSVGDPMWGPLMTDKEFLAFGKNADVWIFIGYDFENLLIGSKKNILQQFKSVKNEEVYSVKRGYYEHRLAEYDVVIQDFCEIVQHNYYSFSPHNLVWFKKILPFNREETDTIEECTLEDIDTPWESHASECIYMKDKSSACCTWNIVNMQTSLVISSVVFVALFCTKR